MKKLLLFTAIFGLFALSSCSKGGGTEVTDPTLEITPESIQMLSAGGDPTFDITSNTEWTIIPEAGVKWYSIQDIKDLGDKTVTIHVEPNNGLRDRESTITVKAGSLEKTLTLNQYSRDSDPSLQISTETLEVTAAGGEPTFDITSNADWTIIPEDGKDWYSLSETEGSGNKTITITVDPSTVDTRESEIKIKSGDFEETLTLKQFTTLTLTPPSIQVSAAGDRPTFAITSNSNWEIFPEEGKDWYEINDTEGSGNKTITIIVEPSELLTSRNSEITVMADNQEKTLTLTQSALNATLEVQSSIMVGPGSLSYELEIESNVAWTITPGAGANWYSFEGYVTGGPGHERIMINIDANTGGQRDSEILITYASQDKKVKLTQRAGNTEPSYYDLLGKYQVTGTPALSSSDLGGDKPSPSTFTVEIVQGVAGYDNPRGNVNADIESYYCVRYWGGFDNDDDMKFYLMIEDGKLVFDTQTKMFNGSDGYSGYFQGMYNELLASSPGGDVYMLWSIDSYTPAMTATWDPQTLTLDFSQEKYTTSNGKSWDVMLGYASYNSSHQHRGVFTQCYYNAKAVMVEAAPAR